MLNKFNLNFVTFFGIGNIKFAPGTFASAVVCLLFYFLIKYIPHSFWFLLIIFFLTLIYAPFAINKTLENFNNESPDQIVNQETFTGDDPKQIVIDEVLGMSIPLLFLSLAFQMPQIPNILQNITSIVWFLDVHTMITKFYAIFYFEYIILVYFLLFRFFDIFKPFPIGYVDKNFKNSFGIILDDILAGLYCIILPFVLTLLLPLLTFIGL